MNNSDIRNNILANEGGGYAAFGYSASGLVVDYNNYYSNGTNIGKWNGSTDVNNLTAWQTATTQDANSLVANPVFVSTIDLHPNQALIDGAGITITNYTTDIEGNTLDTPPDLGAYQFTATGDNAGILSLLPEAPFNPNTYPVSIELFNNGPSTLTSDSLYWSVNEVAQTPLLWSGNLAENMSESVTLGNYQFDEITAYEIKVWSSSPNGQMDINQADDCLLYTSPSPRDS